MQPAQEPLSQPAKLGASVLLGVSISFVTLLSSLAIFYVMGALGSDLYRSTCESLLVAGIAGLSTFAFCFFDYFLPNRFLTGTDRAGFVRLICWLSIILFADAFLESAFVQRVFRPKDGTWFLRWPSQCVLAGFLRLVAGICKKKWGWAIWGICALLWGGLWVFSIFAE